MFSPTDAPPALMTMSRFLRPASYALLLGLALTGLLFLENARTEPLPSIVLFLCFNYHFNFHIYQEFQGITLGLI